MIEKVKLKEICRLINGRAYKQNELLASGKYPVLRVGNFFSDKDYYYSDLELEDDKYCDNGDLLFAWSASFGPKIWNGGKVIYHYHIWKMDLSDRVNRDYLFYYLYYLSERIKSEGHGGIMIHTTKAEMEEREFILPNLSHQKKISKLFAMISNVIAMRKQEIQKLDELIKARFVEIFGNPVLNNKGWKVKPLRDLTTKIGSGATPKGGKEAYRKAGISLIRSMNVYNGQFDYKELAHISDEQASKLDNVIIEKDDVLLNITGASVARSCIVPSSILPARVNQHVCIIRCNEFIIPEFLNKLLIDDNFQNLLWNIAGSGATREAITKQQVENLQIIVPPIKVQNAFMEFCKQVDKSKVAVQKALDDTQLLFNSLMQKYFG